MANIMGYGEDYTRVNNNTGTKRKIFRILGWNRIKNANNSDNGIVRILTVGGINFLSNLNTR
jgi:hypothetical protein